MSPRGTATPLFEDAYTDARMRALMPHFAMLAVLGGGEVRAPGSAAVAAGS